MDNGDSLKRLHELGVTGIYIDVDADRGGDNAVLIRCTIPCTKSLSQEYDYIGTFRSLSQGLTEILEIHLENNNG
jgi:hypothetical protein